MSTSITFLGHSGILIANERHSVVIDPFLTGNPVATMKQDDIKCKTVVLTHGHADHMGDAVKIAKRNDSRVFGVFEICEYCGEHGVGRIESMNVGGEVATDFGFIALTQAFHSSSYNGRYMGMPCGTVVKIDGLTVYHCGDTGLFGDMKLIGEVYKPDIAFIPIGDRFTMGPRLGAKAAELIQPKVAVPVHFGTWPMLTQDAGDFRPDGVEVKVLQPGQNWQWD